MRLGPFSVLSQAHLRYLVKPSLGHRPSPIQVTSQDHFRSWVKTSGVQTGRAMRAGPKHVISGLVQARHDRFSFVSGWHGPRLRVVPGLRSQPDGWHEHDPFNPMHAKVQWAARKHDPSVVWQAQKLVAQQKVIFIVVGVGSPTAELKWKIYWTCNKRPCQLNFGEPLKEVTCGRIHARWVSGVLCSYLSHRLVKDVRAFNLIN